MIGLGHEPEIGGAMADKRDYYDVLGIAKNSSDSEIKAAFRSLDRQNHPEKNPDDPDAGARLKEIQEA